MESFAQPKYSQGEGREVDEAEGTMEPVMVELLPLVLGVLLERMLEDVGLSDEEVLVDEIDREVETALLVMLFVVFELLEVVDGVDGLGEVEEVEVLEPEKVLVAELLVGTELEEPTLPLLDDDVDAREKELSDEEVALLIEETDELADEVEAGRVTSLAPHTPLLGCPLPTDDFM